MASSTDWLVNRGEGPCSYAAPGAVGPDRCVIGVPDGTGAVITLYIPNGG
ncbi:hypothetical protein GCM10009789_02060 [Kribbella sancticallisti]|uniref:Uncharacterized protein n=1 Tax=Kribbella sancticallisti TaxID=460087 RepID=A0ABP4MXN3_9ACTN